MFAGTVDPAILHVLGGHPRGERRDRLVAEELLDGTRDKVGIAADQLPLLGVPGEQSDPMGELSLGCIDASCQDVHDQVEALVIRQPVALVSGGEKRRDQVIARVVTARLDQGGCVSGELDDRRLDLVTAGHDRRRVELALEPRRPVVEAWRVLDRRAHDGGDQLRWIALGHRVHELDLTTALERSEDLGQVLAHDGAPAVGCSRREGRIHKVAQTAVVRALDRNDVLADRVGQRPVRDPERGGHDGRGEDDLLRAQEEVRRLAVEDEDPSRLRSRQPVLGSERLHPVVELVAAEVLVRPVEEGQVELGERWHTRSVCAANL